MRLLLDTYLKFIKKLLSKKASNSSVGLDIGTSECKLVELKKNEDEFELLNLATEPIPNADVASAISKNLKHLENPCKSCYTSVLGKGTLVRYIDMPRMNIDDLKKSFALESDKYFPFGQDKVYTDCYIIDPKSKNNQMLVVAAAAKKDVIDQRVKLLTGLGLQVDFIGINSIAVANIVNVVGHGIEADKGSGVAILDMGDSVSHLMILVDRVPRFNRDIFVGGRDFTKSISNALGISLQAAESLKINSGDKKVEVLRAYEAVVLNLVQELKLSLDYFSTEQNKEVKFLLLTGGGSLLEGITEILSKNLEVTVSHWNPFRSFKISPKVSKEFIDREFTKFTVALGLALYDYD